MTKTNAIRINPRDNVVVVIESVTKGRDVTFEENGNHRTIVAAENVPGFHKLASEPIGADREIIKYGERIGYATADIAAGEHVHIHNVVSKLADEEENRSSQGDEI